MSAVPFYILFLYYGGVIIGMGAGLFRLMCTAVLPCMHVTEIKKRLEVRG